MGIESEGRRLGQAERLAALKESLSPLDMVTVIQTGEMRGLNTHDHFVCSALVPSIRVENVEEVLNLGGFHYDVCAGLPGSTYGFNSASEKSKPRYWRYGNDLGLEPLVVLRSFYGLKENHVEINEEFRLFHNLYYDDKNGHYLKIDYLGDEHVVVIVEGKSDRVQIRLKEIREFLAIKEMHLAVEFSYLEFSELTLEELGLVKDKEARRSRKGSLTWEFFYANLSSLLNGRQSFSSLSGIKLIEPLPKSQSGFPGFAIEPKKKYLDFIVGLNDDGSEKEYTCDKDALADYFGKNRDAPNYLTAVSFKKEVLNKYHEQPTRYEISGDTLWCGELWSVTIDNEHPNKVVVWLGDLGSLPYKEQLYWKSFNFVSDNGPSRSFFTRQILNEMSESELPEHAFMRRYDELSNASEHHLGWPILHSLEDDDQYHLSRLRVPATNEQNMFDEQVLSLTKILIDSLNVQRLKGLISANRTHRDDKSIDILEKALADCAVDNAGEHLAFLRNLQSLRSRSVAHRKGRSYRKLAKKLELDGRDLIKVFEGLLEQAVSFLDFLIEIVNDGCLQETP